MEVLNAANFRPTNANHHKPLKSTLFSTQTHTKY